MHDTKIRSNDFVFDQIFSYSVLSPIFIARHYLPNSIIKSKGNQQMAFQNSSLRSIVFGLMPFSTLQLLHCQYRCRKQHGLDIQCKRDLAILTFLASIMITAAIYAMKPYYNIFANLIEPAIYDMCTSSGKTLFVKHSIAINIIKLYGEITGNTSFATVQMVQWCKVQTDIYVITMW